MGSRLFSPDLSDRWNDLQRQGYTDRCEEFFRCMVDKALANSLRSTVLRMHLKFKYSEVAPVIKLVSGLHVLERFHAGLWDGQH